MSVALTIDGNFFAQRLRAAANLTFIDNPEQDRKELFKVLATSLASEIKQQQNVIEQIYFCRDWSSWRKKFTQTYPLESVKSEEKQVYKENRGGDQSYDPIAFFKAFDEWCILIEEKLQIPVIKTKGAEADDIVYVVSQSRSAKGNQSYCWTSDGDYIQLVNDNVMLLKLPQRHLYKTSKNTIVNEQKSLHSVFNKKVSTNKLHLIEKTFGSDDIKATNPMKSLLLKVICEDKKDNVPAVFTWKSKNGAKTFKPSALQVSKALDKLGFDLASIEESHLYDKDFMLNFLTQLFIVTKATRDLDHTYNVYLSNLKMKHLSHKQIPKEIMLAIIEQYNLKKDMQPSISKLSNYKYILEQCGEVETSSFFKGFKLD